MSNGNNRFPIRRVLLALALLLGVITTALVIRMQDSQSKNAAAGTPARADLRGVAVPGGANDEAENLARREAADAIRWGLPGQKLDSKWLLEAQKAVLKMPSGIPAGKVVYNKARSNAPLALDPNAMVSLGAQPAQSDGCFLCFNYGLVSGRINSIAIDPVVTSTVYLGVSNGGVWKTTNCCTEGTVWTPTTDDPSIGTQTIDEVTIDPNNHEIVYAATGDFRPSSAARGSQGILRSTDAGASWEVLGANIFVPFRNNGQPIGGSSQYQAVTAVKVDPNNSNTLIAGTKTELWMSYDMGDNWTGPCYTNPYTATAGNQRQDNTEILVRDEGTTTTIFYAIGSPQNSAAAGGNGANGVYTATMPSSGCPSPWTLVTRADNGWPGQGTPGTADNAKGGRIDLAMAPSNPAVLYAAQGTMPSGGIVGIYRTSNSGVSWTLVATPTKFVDCVGGAGIGGQAWYDQLLEVDPTNPDYLWYGEIDVFRSSNGGANWRDASCVYSGGDYIHPDQHDARYFPGQNNEMLIANDGGIYYTNRAYSVTASLPRFPVIPLNQSMNTLEFYNGQLTGNFATSDQPGANGGTQDNGSFVNIWEGGQESVGPEQWDLRIGGDGFFAAIEPVNNQVWYQENNSSQIWRSTSGPYGVYQNVSGFATNNPWANDGRNFSMPFEIYKYDCPPTGCTHLIAGTYRVWETQNGAQNSASWYINSPPLTKSVPSPGWGASPNITQLSYAVSMSTTAIVGTTDGNVQYGFNLGTTPGSATWVNVTGGNTVLPNRPILDVTTDPANPIMGYAAVGGFSVATPATPGHVFRVTCANAPTPCASFTWEDKTGNLPDLPATAIVVNPNYRQQVFVGTDGGLFFTNDIDAATPVWIRFTNGLPNVWIYDLNVDRGFTTLAVWTRNRGAYAWPLPSAPFVQPTPTNTPIIVGTPPTATPTETVEPVTCNTTVMTSTGHTLLPATNSTGVIADDGVAVVQLPFAVPVYDRYFTQAYATTNGHLLFGAASVGTYGCVPARGETYSIHANSGDLCTNDCSGPTDPCVDCGIFTNTIGTAPNRQFVVRWKAGYYNLAGTTEFEVVLTEGSNSIQVIIGSDAYAGAATTNGMQRGYLDNVTSINCFEGGTITNTMSITYTISGCPAPTFTPTPLPTNTVTPTAPPTCTIQFQDVPPSNAASSFYPYVRCLACRNIVGGYPCGDVNPVSGQPEPCGATGNAYYRPDNPVTRGQIAKIVAQSAGYTGEPGPQIYADVPPDQVFWLYVQQLSNDGVMGGYPCGGTNPQTGEDEECDVEDRPYFRVNNHASRGQLAKIVFNAAGITYTGSSQTYQDVPPSNSPSSFYPYIEGLSQLGVMGGYACGTSDPRSGPCTSPGNRPYFRPANNVTRGQAAKIVANTFFPNCETPARPSQ
ncbi:MAG: S-layer homology domain-containing protein [Chloroflexota bacterium]|nr:S-layer homology domain-containing protein [Chloroflexota bacterium]